MLNVLSADRTTVALRRSRGSVRSVQKDAPELPQELRAAVTELPGKAPPPQAGPRRPLAPPTTEPSRNSLSYMLELDCTQLLFSVPHFHGDPTRKSPGSHASFPSWLTLDAQQMTERQPRLRLAKAPPNQVGPKPPQE